MKLDMEIGHHLNKLFEKKQCLDLIMHLNAKVKMI